MSSPQFILCEAAAPASDATMGYAAGAREILEAHGGEIIVAAPADAAQPLEVGTEKHALVALKFSAEGAAKAFWADPAHRELFSSLESTPGFLHAISITGIPEEGLPGEPLPTTATVTIPDNPAPSGWMLVQGTISDPGPIARYMEILVPMIVERGGVYRVWTDPDGPELLAGDWPRQYVVFSEYPSIEVANELWYSDTYQNEAILARKPASDFRVLLFEANAAARVQKSD